MMKWVNRILEKIWESQKVDLDLMDRLVRIGKSRVSKLQMDENRIMRF
jgi:hypothetical protein